MVITFYSYKGGVGRTQLLANAAIGLVNRGLKIVMLDMDLESPGLHNFFYDPHTNQPISSADYSTRPGLIDALSDHLNGADKAPDVASLISKVKHPNQRDGELWLLHAGRFDAKYPELVATFPWERFYGEAQGYAYMEYLRYTLLHGDPTWRGVDAVLIDSRTGFTDIGSICTGQLPDLLVILFALHIQGIEGARQIARAVKEYSQADKDKQRLRKIVLLPSRVDESGSIEQRDKMLGYASENLFGLGDLLAGLWERLPYDPRIAYGEQIIVGSGNQPTTLSQAYESFVDLVIESGPLAAATIRQGMADERRPATAPVQLYAVLEELKTAADEVADLWKQLQTSNLENLANAAHRLIDAHRGAQTEYRKFLAGAAMLASSAGVAVEELADTLPQQWSAWEPLISKLNKICSQVSDAWMDAWEVDARRRLVSVADSPRSEVDQLLSKLRGRARHETTEVLETLVAEAEQYVRRDSLNQLLQDRKLTSAELNRVIPDNENKRRWLEHRLTRLQEEGDLTDERIINQLWNSLDLLSTVLSESGNRPDPVHWSAYDILCMTISALGPEDLSERDLKCFEEVGDPLWKAEWAGLVSQSRWGDPDWPCGLEARKQLERVSRVPRALDSVVEAITPIFGPRARVGDDFKRLLEFRNDDPILERIILAIGVDASVVYRREILASWLSIRRRQASGLMLAVFLHALAEDGFEAEAFYGGCALLAREPHIFRENRAFWGNIVARFVILLWERKQYSTITELLLDEELLTTLLASTTGNGVLASLAMIVPASRSVDLDLSLFLRAGLMPRLAEMLPRQVITWLEDLREKEKVIEEPVAAEIVQLNDEARSHLEITVYRAWEAAVYFQKAFKEYWETIYELLIQEHRSLEALKREHLSEPAEDWIDRTGKQLRAQGRRANRPEGKAKQHLIDAYRNVVDSLTKLLDARPAGKSIAEVLRQHQSRSQAVDSLRNWIVGHASAPDNSAMKRLSQHVQGLLT